ncbi:hypothetical protein QAD02_022080 [Eretmocerus hayati]|uniref:Uncharacterized protein n=1 Tax=Eretmocerus hayati TaxID=131215 RepID=A0ACC2PRY8_9HYME|nr:hypothetical protein QAD02_022080 [Eretmocerus hayati]
MLSYVFCNERVFLKIWSIFMLQLTFYNHITVDETVTYTQHPEDNSKTLLTQEAVVKVHGVPLTHYMEDLLASKISFNASKGRQAIEWVIDKIDCEVRDLATTAAKTTDELLETTRRQIDDFTNITKRSMDEIQSAAKKSLDESNSMSSAPSQGFSTPLPADLLPDCWNQDERMKSLFAPFRNRSVNAEDWNSKYKFWNQFVKKWASYHACCSFSLDDLNSKFKRNGCTALCLPTVLQELYRNGEVIAESDFLKEPSNTWTGWTVDVLVKKPLSWSFSKLKSYISEPVLENDTKYVHLATVKELGELILSVVDKKKENSLISLSELKKSCIEKSGNDRITEKNIKLALIWLRHNKKAAFKDPQTNSEDDLLVKISPKVAEHVTEVDEGVHRLSQQEKMLIQNIEQLETERNDVIIAAKSALASGLKQVAKSLLRKKHEIDKCIEKRSAALQNVQRLLARINDARYDTDTLAAYKAGCDALKKFEDGGLTQEDAINTMDDVAEILEELNEVQSVMTQPVSCNETDVELEKELAEIMASSWDDANISSKNTDKSTGSIDLPNLSELDLLDLPAPKGKALTQQMPSI